MADAHDLPLAAAGHAPRRVMTIAGSDSGGSAGLQADMRTFAMLGVHGCAAVTAVTVQNSLGVKAFHEVPVEVVAGQISAVASDIGIEAAKTGMLASTDIIRTIVATWKAERLAGTVPLVVDPVCASNVGEPLLHPSALGAMREELIPLATLVTPNLDEVRLLVGTDVVAPPGKKFGTFTRPHVRYGRPLDFSRYEGMENDRYILRSITDEIMYEIMRLSGQEYVDMYATVAKEEAKKAERAEKAVDRADKAA